jgi:aminopeptidase N
MESLKRSMAWDEQVYQLEYDLDEYNIVAVRHFNMGAMENKSLNIFNSKLVLADAETATDAELERIESVIAHEYFHNWSGNRITCRDWFQLSLKEGLTVFRDQSFTADLHSAAVKRIEDVAMLRNTQFREDAGPTAHPVKPAEYQAIDNLEKYGFSNSRPPVGLQAMALCHAKNSVGCGNLPKRCIRNQSAGA